MNKILAFVIKKEEESIALMTNKINEEFANMSKYIQHYS